MVDYREILRLQSLGHNITQIAGSLHSSRNTVREVERLADEKRDPVATWRGGNQSAALCPTLSGTAETSKSLSRTGLCLDPP